jgi:hypothetical protein
VCYRNTAAAGWAPSSSIDSSGTCASGVEDLILGALLGNTDAIRLYERRGYQPTWLYLTRLTGAVEPLPGGCEPRSSATMGKAIRIKSEGTSPHE